MAGWHHRLDGHEFEETLRAGDGQGGLECCGSRGRKESDATELNRTELGAHALQQEKPSQREARAPQQGSSPVAAAIEKP